MHKYRQQSVKVRIDAFYEYLPNAKDIRDNKMHAALTKTVMELSEMCFHQCVDSQFRVFINEESICVTKCVNGYFGRFEEVVRSVKKDL